MTNAEEQPPSRADAEAIGDYAEALYERLRGFAKSWGVLDIGVEVDGWYVDGEVQFTKGPDMGFSVHAGAGECHYCELVGEAGEQWLEHVVTGLAPLDGGADGASVQVVLDGLLDARRPLLTRE